MCCNLCPTETGALQRLFSPAGSGEKGPEDVGAANGGAGGGAKGSG
ncbi:hypothetical protein EYF80_058672 [Liparis tanakae]|uniref:Uncharacterized protein n=1 Tax=Liparis tanakae TaxID=230148 RepID=A0A4Z2EQI3_9TELE|nr:hypothetical protein EYF80_058672 [Liparis tanakae]